MTTLIITFLLATGGTLTQAHTYQDAADCTTMARLLDGQLNPLGERMITACVKGE